MPDEPIDQSKASSTSRNVDADAAGADSTGGAAVEATLPDATAKSQVGGGARRHPDPTRYGDWEKGGRCIDF